MATRAENKHRRERRQRRLLKKQIQNLDIYVCKIYWCVACKKFRIKDVMRYYHVWPVIKSLKYAGWHVAVPCLCRWCMRVEKYKQPWIKRYWVKKPILRFVLESEKRKNLFPWEKGYGNKIVRDTSKGPIKKITGKKYKGIFW